MNNDFPTRAFIAYKKNLAGLPSFCRLVMLEVFEYCDHAAGTISIKSLDKLARDSFYVDSSRGRAKEDINGDTLRNAFRSIKKAKSDYFHFTSINQQIVIDMPFLRELHQSIYNETAEVAAVVATDVAAVTTLSQHGESVDLDPILAVDVAGVLAAASFDSVINVHAKIKSNPTKPNNNKQVSDEFSDLKKPIGDDFFPSQFVIDKALNLGFSKVTDAAELNKFILFNKATGSEWKHFDYVYLTWLQRDAERELAMKEKEKQQQPTFKRQSNTTTAGRSNHGTCNNNEKSRVTQRVIAAHSDELEFCQHTNRFNPRTTTNTAPIKYLSFDTLGSVV